MLKKCLIANRGEIAVRIIRACQELGITSVAIYSTVDAHAMHVTLADEAYPLGGASPQESYLNAQAILAIAQRAGCDSVHPAFGFLSEREDFAQAVIDAGLIWVGPAPSAIEAMGVKTFARALMQQAGVPVVPGYLSDNATLETLTQEAQKIGFPLMVKAAGGGGGKGIRIVHQISDLENALLSARNEAQRAFGDDRLFLERYIAHGRHIEFQILADTHGNVVHLFERECSVQRRHQKIIEETPSPLLSPAMRQQMGEDAIKAARAVNYTNAGTIEFIATPDSYYFLEMNTRLQVEHPITEQVVGIDIVQWQLRIASGEALTFRQEDLRQQGHAIECRLYAEDPRNNFLPSIGRVLRFIPPNRVRVERGIRDGDEITVHYDPMIAKIIAHASTRQEAIARMRQALSETVILGTMTNLDFLQALLSHPIFLHGEMDTAYVDTHLHEIMPDMPDTPDLALIALALSETPTAQKALAQSNHGDAYSPWDTLDHFRLGV